MAIVSGRIDRLGRRSSHQYPDFKRDRHQQEVGLDAKTRARSHSDGSTSGREKSLNCSRRQPRATDVRQGEQHHPVLALPEIVTGNEQNQRAAKTRNRLRAKHVEAGCRGQARNCSDRQDGHCDRKYRCGDIEP